MKMLTLKFKKYCYDIIERDSTCDPIHYVIHRRITLFIELKKQIFFTSDEKKYIYILSKN